MPAMGVEEHVQEVAPGAVLVVQVRQPLDEAALEGLSRWVTATYPGELVAAGDQEWLRFYLRSG